MNAPNAPTYLHYTLTLRSPVIVSTASGDPNSTATQPFIPGSAIRGAVAARLLAQGKAANSAAFRTLILFGAVRYLHAYPLIGGARGLPTPASWWRQKDRLEASHDLATYSGEGVVTFTAEAAREYANVAGLLSQEVRTGTRFRALLTSAYIGRHPSTGQIDPLALDHELQRRLGHPASIDRRRWSFETVGGFNKKWRLALPQALAVAAGAVLVLRARQPISLETLREIEHEGLGERRAEGFGRLLFLTHTESRETIRLESEERRRVATHDAAVTPAAGPSQASQPAQDQLAFLEQRIILAAAEAELERVAADIAGTANLEDIPTNSLLGRLRTAFRGAQDNASAAAALQTLATWCGDDGSQALKAPARQQLNACRVGNKNLRDWLRDLASPPDGTSRWRALVRAPANAGTLTALAQDHHLTNPDNAQAVLNDHVALLSVR